jgi:hypothetical protein
MSTHKEVETFSKVRRERGGVKTKGGRGKE